MGYARAPSAVHIVYDPDWMAKVGGGSIDGATTKATMGFCGYKMSVPEVSNSWVAELVRVFGDRALRNGSLAVVKCNVVYPIVFIKKSSSE
ncbi:MAG: hypothetical protein LBI34_04035 [Puniceicoccales bacterium]|jgi:glucan biosynthesis protein|nr:hypothetical protein [Puniceicoccales bacterium]